MRAETRNRAPRRSSGAAIALARAHAPPGASVASPARACAAGQAAPAAATGAAVAWAVEAESRPRPPNWASASARSSVAPRAGSRHSATMHRTGSNTFRRRGGQTCFGRGGQQRVAASYGVDGVVRAHDRFLEPKFRGNFGQDGGCELECFPVERRTLQSISS